jgi:hypothetical protein
MTHRNQPPSFRGHIIHRPYRWPRSEALLATGYSTTVPTAPKHEVHGHRCAPLFSAEGTQFSSRLRASASLAKLPVVIGADSQP